MRELKQIAIVCVAIVAAVFAWADIPNVFDLDLDAPREEAPTVVPTRPPDDPMSQTALLRRCFSERGGLSWITLTWLTRTG